MAASHPEVKAVNLISYLKCGACKEFAVGEIRNCKAGHIVCGICWNHGRMGCADKKCETRTLFGMWAISNILKAEGVTFPCRHKGYGCELMIESDQMENHLDNHCDFRPTKCEELNPCCDNKWYAPKDFVHHLFEHHGMERLEQDLTTGVEEVLTFNGKHCITQDVYLDAKYKGPFWPTTYFEYDNQMFFCHIRIIYSKFDITDILTWITMLGSDEVAKKYEYAVTFTSKGSSLKTKYMIRHGVPVRSLQNYGSKNVMDSKDAAIINFLTLRLRHETRCVAFGDKYRWEIMIQFYKRDRVLLMPTEDDHFLNL